MVVQRLRISGAVLLINLLLYVYNLMSCARINVDIFAFLSYHLIKQVKLLKPVISVKETPVRFIYSLLAYQ
jgi:hypothetical protein